MPLPPSKTKKNKIKHNLLLKKYEFDFFSEKTHIYVLDFQAPVGCRNHITLKSALGGIKKTLVDKFQVLELLEHNEISTTHIPKTHKFVESMGKVMKRSVPYTYCLNPRSLLMAETSHMSRIKDYLSKHVLLCGARPCVSGEMRFDGERMIFDNNSGTYKPAAKHLENLKMALRFAGPGIEIKVLNKTRKNSHAKTRHTRRSQRGGALLGEGAHGKTYNLGCATDDKETFCDMFEAQKAAIEKVTLYTLHDQSVISSSKDIDDFMTFLSHTKNKIAKVFKPVGVFSRKSLKTKLDEEIYFNRKIAQVYGSTASKFLTTAPLSGFKDHQIMGAILHSKSAPSTYVVFGSKCNPKYHFHVKEFLIDLLESLVVLQAKNYTHADIKDDNIVLCDDRYKLIDWGAAGKLVFTNKPTGSKYTNGPLRWYVGGETPILAKSRIPLRALIGKASYLFKSRFQEQYWRILREFDEVIAETSDREVLFRKYCKSFDVFSLGMTLLYALLDNKAPYEKYIHIVEALTSLKAPLDAVAALEYVRSL